MPLKALIKPNQVSVWAHYKVIPFKDNQILMEAESKLLHEDIDHILSRWREDIKKL